MTESYELSQRVRTILSELTLAEKISLLAGKDTWHFGGVPRLGIPPLRVADCGHGITFVDEGAPAVTCLPTAIGMGATWDPELIREAGEVLGRECRAMGIGILLGPMVNLQRLPVGGRNFEAYSEDTYLTGVLGAAMVNGIQSTGTGACAKHIACYGQTKFSQTHSVEVDERTLHELYLRHFAYIVANASPTALMTSYNKVNGEDTASHRGLLTDYVRGTLGFDGVIMSDWGGVHDADAILAGLDLEMPGPAKHLAEPAVRRLIEDGRLTLEELDAHVSRILRANLEHAVEVGVHRETDTARHRLLTRKVAESSITLLKNDASVLPLNIPALRRIAVVGPNAATARLGGSGSASVTPSYSISPLEGLRARLGPEVDVVYSEGCPAHGSGRPVKGWFSHRLATGESAGGLIVEFFNNIALEAAPAHRGVTDEVNYAWGWAAPARGVRRGYFGVRFSGEITVPAQGAPTEMHLLYEAGGARVWVDDVLVHDNWDPAEHGVFENRYGAFFARLPITHNPGQTVSFRLEYRQLASGSALRLEVPSDENDSLLTEAIDLARDADAVIVCAGLKNRFEGGGTDRETLSLPEGQDTLIEKLAAVNPRTIVVLNGAAAMGMPWLDRVAAVLHAYYPGQEGGAALARILCGDVSPSGRLPLTLPGNLSDLPAMASYPGDEKSIVLKEGLFVGYRHFVSGAKEKPVFPFGFGLTYSEFIYGNLELSDKMMSPDESLEVSVVITNTGRCTASEVVQLYVGVDSLKVHKPSWELRRFCKVQLAPAESQTVRFSIGLDDVSYYCPEAHRWMIDPESACRVRVGPHCLQGLEASFELASSPSDIYLTDTPEGASLCVELSNRAG